MSYLLYAPHWGCALTGNQTQDRLLHRFTEPCWPGQTSHISNVLYTHGWWLNHWTAQLQPNSQQNKEQRNYRPPTTPQRKCSRYSFVTFCKPLGARAMPYPEHSHRQLGKLTDAPSLGWHLNIF